MALASSKYLNAPCRSFSEALSAREKQAGIHARLTGKTIEEAQADLDEVRQRQVQYHLDTIRRFDAWDALCQEGADRRHRQEQLTPFLFGHGAE